MQHELTITINASNQIEVRDSAGNARGDLTVKDGDLVTWTNETEKKCTLKFKKLKTGPTPGSKPVWPFKPPRNGNEVDIPKPPPGQKSKFSGTIDKKPVEPGPSEGRVKYDVHVTGHAPLDPIIIIRQ